jgi:hypothetical protein
MVLQKKALLADSVMALPGGRPDPRLLASINLAASAEAAASALRFSPAATSAARSSAEKSSRRFRNLKMELCLAGIPVDTSKAN